MLWTRRRTVEAASLIEEANSLVQTRIVKHERADEGEVYPELSKVLIDRRALSAMSRAHREIQAFGPPARPRRGGPVNAERSIATSSTTRSGSS